MKSYLSFRNALIVAVGIVVTVAGIRVWQAVNNPRRSQDRTSRVIAQETQVIKDAKVPDYQPSDTEVDREALQDQIRRQVYLMLLDLPEPDRPGIQDAERIADAFTNYYALNRYGTLDDLLESYDSRGLKPRNALIQDDRERAEKAWLFSVVWARHRPLDPNAIGVESRYIRGIKSGPNFSSGGGISSRKLASGQFVSQGEHPYTVYAVLVRAEMLDLTGKVEFDTEVEISITNDGPHGHWSVLSCRFGELPEGVQVTLPYP